MNTRQTEIIRLLGQKEKISVTELSEFLNTSQVTIRKDLGELEEQGFIKRQHGYAINVSQDDVAGRLLFDYDIKTKIAQKAASMVSNGETVMIESGSTCALLARELAETKSDVTIITNSAFIADFVRGLGTIKIILLGGDYQPESKVTVGTIAKLSAQQFFVNKLFCGADGYVENYGFTIINYMRADTVVAMGEQAERVIVLADSSKFEKRGVANQFSFQAVDTVITDTCLPEEKRLQLEKNHIQVVEAEK